MRLVVAMVGGLLPLSALLFSHRLRNGETIALALTLGANPILIYYSRFYRNDLLLAGFMLVAFGFFVRAYDHHRPAFVYLGTAVFALAFTTKENALVYPVVWVGAAVLLWDRWLLVNRIDDCGFRSAVVELVQKVASGVRNWWLHLALATLEFFAIFVFFYAPRGEAANAEPTLSATLTNPTLLPALVEEAVLGSWNAFVDQWGNGNQESYLSAAGELWSVLAAGALVVVGLAVMGFVVDRYVGKHPRDIVAFAAYWGFASALGYPIIVDNPFPWEVVHIVVPLTIPAAVGLALVGRIGLTSLADRNTISVIAATFVLLVVAGQVSVTAYDTSFAEPQNPDNELVQYAQPASEMKPLLGEVRRIVVANDGADVLYYGDDPNFNGDELYAPNPQSHDMPIAGEGWFERLPFAWYLEVYGAETNSTEDATFVRRAVSNDDRPPVVIAFGRTPTCTNDYDNASDIDQYLEKYERKKVERFLFDTGCTISNVVIYVDDDYETVS